MIPSVPQSALCRYLLAVLASGVAAFLANVSFFDGMQFGIFLFAVVVTSWFVGAGPGLLAALLSALAIEYFLLPPVFSLAIASFQDVLRLAVFVLAALFVSVTARMVPQVRPAAPSLLAQRKNQTALACAAAAFEELVNLVPDQATFLLDNQGRVVAWSAPAERLTGFSVQQILHHHFERLYPASALPSGTPRFALQSAAARQAGHEEETVFERCDGSRFRAQLFIRALREPSGDAPPQSATAPPAAGPICGFLVKVRVLEAGSARKPEPGLQ